MRLHNFVHANITCMSMSRTTIDDKGLMHDFQLYHARMRRVSSTE